jgi:hypothetical protein
MSPLWSQPSELIRHAFMPGKSCHRSGCVALHFSCRCVFDTSHSTMIYSWDSSRRRSCSPFFPSSPRRRVVHSSTNGIYQRQSTLDCRYLSLLCDNLKKRMFLQNFFSWHYFGNLSCYSSYPHHSTILQPNSLVLIVFGIYDPPCTNVIYIIIQNFSLELIYRQ